MGWPCDDQRLPGEGSWPNARPNHVTPDPDPGPQRGIALSSHGSVSERPSPLLHLKEFDQRVQECVGSLHFHVFGLDRLHPRAPSIQTELAGHYRSPVEGGSRKPPPGCQPRLEAIQQSCPRYPKTLDERYNRRVTPVRQVHPRTPPHLNEQIAGLVH